MPAAQGAVFAPECRLTQFQRKVPDDAASLEGVLQHARPHGQGEPRGKAPVMGETRREGSAMNATAAIKGIRQAAKARNRADAAKAKATQELQSHCKEAQEAGLPVTRIASEASLSRQGVYNLLAERCGP